MSPLNIDWNMLVIKLRHHKNMVQMSRELGIDVNVLHRYSSGVNTTEPKFSVGIKLLDYYYDHVGDMEAIKLCK